MLNVLIPLAGHSTFFPEGEYHYPRPLIEIAGKPMIQHVIENLRTLGAEVRFHFVVNKDDCQRFHLDKVLTLLCGAKTGLIRLDGPTKGAACSCLMAIGTIPPEEPLVIANADQILEAPLDAVLARFARESADAGIIVFDAIHPRWSFARIEEGLVVETGEKMPISNHAIAGFYYFAKAASFFDAAQKSIRRNASVDGVFYIAPVFNELVLAGEKILAEPLAKAAYHSFYTPQKLSEYEAYLALRASS